MRCFALCLAVFFVALLEQVPVGFDNKCFSPAVCFSVTSSVTEITLQCGIASRFSMWFVSLTDVYMAKPPSASAFDC